MVLAVGAAFLFQVSIQIGGSSTRQPTVVRDSSGDSSHARAPHRLPVTAKDVATAFSDDALKALYMHARAARLQNDSSLHSYDVKTHQRLSVGMGLGTLGKDHLLYRQESVTRVQWQLGIGAWIDMMGARVAIPMAPSEAETDAVRDGTGDRDMSPIPYFPGMEALWLGGSVTRSDVDDRDVVNPLGDGAEAYYTFERGDSIRMTLPDKSVIDLKEVRFRPRSPKWNLAVGSLMFDAATGQLVEAIYRLSVPLDFMTEIGKQDTADAPPAIVKALVSPLRAQITSVVVEYGLFDGHYWLPKIRAFEGSGDVMFAHVPIKIEQSFDYAKVNGPDTLPVICTRGRGGRNGPACPLVGPLRAPDSLSGQQARIWIDSAGNARTRARMARRDSINRKLIPDRPAACDTSDTYVLRQLRYNAQVPVAIRVPCDVEKLIHSPEFTSSIYDPGEEAFGGKERDELIGRALALTAQAPLSLVGIPKPTFKYGVALTRYNRVEGFSTGLGLDQQLTSGYSASALARFGFADHEPNVELGLSRTNLAKTITLTGYNRLVAANDWGHPLSFGSSLRAALFGRDEGFYYRESGADVTITNETGAHIQWRFFGEEERTAAQHTTVTLGAPFGPNINAARGAFYGGSMRWTSTFGLNPDGFQFVDDLRLEAATGDSTYGRGAVDAHLSHGLGRGGNVSIGGSVGSSVGALPVQRFWFLGGTETIRGQSPDTTQKGNAFWMGHAEVGWGPPAVRTVVFGDLGWVGSRTAWSSVGRPLSGVGLGWTFLDDIIRFDVARGLYPRKQWRVDLYLEGRY